MSGQVVAALSILIDKANPAMIQPKLERNKYKFALENYRQCYD
jgi:hypothetical protein